MKIDLASLTDQELSALLMGAMKEWASRQPGHQETQIVRQPAPKPRIITLKEPPERDKEFVLSLKARLIRGQYIKAGEREAVAEIAEHYPQWVLRQGLPTEKGTRAWRDAADRLCFYKPADER